MKVYGINSCGSVKKAKAFFDENQISYEFIDLSKEPVKEDKLNYWLNFVEIKELLNPRSKAYRDNNLKDAKMTGAKKLKLIAKENGLLKRPLIEHGLDGEEKFYAGFNQEDYNSIFLS